MPVAIAVFLLTLGVWILVEAVRGIRKPISPATIAEITDNYTTQRGQIR